MVLTPAQVIHRTPVPHLGDELHHTSERAACAGGCSRGARHPCCRSLRPPTHACKPLACSTRFPSIPLTAPALLQSGRHVHAKQALPLTPLPPSRPTPPGWNACASCHLDATKRRAFLVAPALGSGRVYGAARRAACCCMRAALPAGTATPALRGVLRWRGAAVCSRGTRRLRACFPLPRPTSPATTRRCAPPRPAAFDVATDPRAPSIHKVVEPEEIQVRGRVQARAASGMGGQAGDGGMRTGSWSAGGDPGGRAALGARYTADAQAAQQAAHLAAQRRSLPPGHTLPCPAPPTLCRPRRAGWATCTPATAWARAR